jgi:hypothetical protein
LFLIVQLGCNDIVTPPPSGGGGGGSAGGGSDCPAAIGNTFTPAFSCTSGCTVSELDFVEDSPGFGTLLNSRLIGPFQ